MKQRHVGVDSGERKSSVMKVKIVLIVSVKNVVMTQTPVLINFQPFLSPKRDFLDTISPSWSIKVFLVAVAVVSPIYR